MSDLKTNAAAAKKASRILATLTSDQKNAALLKIAEVLKENAEKIFAENKIDLENATKAELPLPILKRLKFDEAKLEDCIAGINSLVNLEDPVNKVKLHTTLDDGLELYRVTCPIGVIGLIFESRPDAVIQIATLCLKSGNAVFLKGGSEAERSNKILSSLIYEAGVKAGLPEGWLFLLTSRADVNEMLSLNNYIDLIIPRGSNAFVQYIMKNTTIAVLGHADGVCHSYIDSEADIEKAIKVVFDAKTQYVATCNTTETVLINRAVKDQVLGRLIEKLKEKNVEFFADDEISSEYGFTKVTDWHTEYLDYKVSLKLVNDIDEAIEHINTYGSGHTDAIITENKEKAEKFMLSVDSGCVFVNCSTRFSDGFRFGFGAEVGVSTSKLHARGPVGLEGLISYKYKLIGDGATVNEFASHERTFKHVYHKV